MAKDISSQPPQSRGLSAASSKPNPVVPGMPTNGSVASRLARELYLRGPNLMRYAPSSMPNLGGVACQKATQNVVAPVDGIFYLSSSDSAAIRIKNEDIVEFGQVLGHIELFKKQFLIKAPCKGKVEAIKVEPGQKVQVGQTLLLIKPST